MAKITLPSTNSGYNLSVINTALQSVATELNTKVLYRDTPEGEPNAMQQLLDMNDNEIINVSRLSASSLRLGGVDIEIGDAVPIAAATLQTFEYTATAGQTQFSVSPLLPLVSSLTVSVNGFDVSPSYISIVASVVTLPAREAGDEVVIRVFTREIGTAPTADDVQYTPGGASSTTRTVADKLDDVIDIRDKGAVEGGDIELAIERVNAEQSEVVIPDGNWVVAVQPTYTGSTVLKAKPGANLTGANAANLGFYTGTSGVEQSVHRNTSGTDAASFYFRRQANHTGGAPGFVNACIRADTFVENSGAAAFEWGIVGVMYNYSDAGENVGGYFQGLKYALGPTWGAVVEVKEMLNTADPTTGTVGLEVDIRANGTDANNARVGVDLVLGKNNSGGSAATAGYGFRLQSAEGAGVNTFVRGFSTFNTTCVVGFDTSETTITQAAFKMAAGQSVAFDAAASRQVFYDGIGLKFVGTAGAFIFRINDTGIPQFGIVSTAAATPANFVANRTIRIQQGDGTVLYLPAMLAGW